MAQVADPVAGLTASLPAWCGSAARWRLSAVRAEAWDSIGAEERAEVASAVPARQHEFATGRVLAHELFAELGVACPALLRDAGRGPHWPNQVDASLSHCEGQVLVVARPTTSFGLGVDLERITRFDSDERASFLTAREQAYWEACSVEDAHRGVTQAFAIKEAIFKAMQRLGNAGLDFLAVEVIPGSSTDDAWHVQPLADLARRLPSTVPVVRAWSRAADGWVLAVVDLPETTSATQSMRP